MQFNPLDMTNKEIYKILVGSVVPRPIAWVSTRSAEGVNNLAPFSFFTIASRQPPMLAITVCPDWPGHEKDTLRNAKRSGEFVVNIVTESTMTAMAVTAADWPVDVDEFEQAGLTSIPSALVKAPMVAESPIQFECKLHQHLELGTDSLLIGEVIMMHVADDLLEKGRINPWRLQPVGRLAGSAYSRFRDHVEEPTPVVQREPGKLPNR